VYFRFPQLYVAALNLLLISIIVYFLALGVSNGIKLHLVRLEGASVPESHGQRVLRGSPTGPLPRSYYDTIVRRDIFSRAPVGPPPAPPVQNEPLNVTLIGTSHLSVGKPFIIVESTDGEQSLYRQGETIPNVGRVLSIGGSQAIVLHNGHRVALQIPKAGEGGTSEPMPFTLRRRGFRSPPRFLRRKQEAFGPYGALGSDKGVHQLGPNRYLIGRATLDQNLGNMASLFTQIRAVPNLQNGSANGFRLSQIQPGSIFQQIGLEEGDVVTGAQGQQVSDPLRAMALVSALRNSPSISLSVIRNGSPLQINYSIR
jgi:type II secretion system protein C